MELTTQIVMIAAGVYLLAGVLKGTLGVGFPTAVIAMMATVVDARTAILLAVIPMIVTNIWQIIRSGRILECLKNLWPMAVTMMIFIMLFTRISVDLPIEKLTFFVGIAIALFAVTSLWIEPPALSMKYKLPVQIASGGFAGMMGGVAGIWAPALILYLSAMRVDKEEFVASIGMLLLLGSLMLLATFWQTGVITVEHAQISLLLVVPSIIGFVIGESLRSKISNDAFRKLMLWFFLFMGLNLAWRSMAN
jgi:uncharacterized membrane protein YfcA